MNGMTGGSAVVYLRTSSAVNVGGDSDHRQRVAIKAYAKSVGLQIVAEFYDAAVSGADPIEERPGFAQMLEHIESEGVRVVMVEDASRFARSVIAQELGSLHESAQIVRDVGTCHERKRTRVDRSSARSRGRRVGQIPASISDQLDDNLALSAPSIEIGECLLRLIEWKNPVDHWTNMFGFDEAADFG